MPGFWFISVRKNSLTVRKGNYYQIVVALRISWGLAFMASILTSWVRGEVLSSCKSERSVIQLGAGTCVLHFPVPPNKLPEKEPNPSSPILLLPLWDCTPSQTLTVSPAKETACQKIRH